MLKPFYENSLVTLYQGDCLEIMPQLDMVFDACITDPPYGTTSCKWDAVVPFDKMWEQLNRLVKENGIKAFTASQPFTSMIVSSNYADFKHEWIWVKNRGSNFANTVREPFKEHEEIVVFCSKGNWTYNKQMQERAESGKARVDYRLNFVTSSENYRKFSDRTDMTMPKLRVPSSVQKFNTEVGMHPTQKPVALIEYLVKTYTNEGESVLDFTAGSGTTGVACMNLKRRCVLIEKEEKYCNTIVERLAKADSQMTLF